MPTRDNRLAIPAGPGWTSVYRTQDQGGADGVIGAREMLVSCAAESANPAEYRLESPEDPPGQQATLLPGESVRLTGARSLIRHVVMRGVGGAATGGVESLVV